MKPLAKRVRNALDPLAVARYRAISGERRPIPPGALRARAGEPAIGRFLASAQPCVSNLEAAIAFAGHSLADRDAVLDFGCGCCRVLAAVAEVSGPSLFGCDVDGEAVSWARRHHGGLKLAHSHQTPPLPYDDGAFDLVYSSSVFTHIDRDTQREWLKELRRVLQPGGLAIISIYGQHAFDGYRSGSLVGVSRDFRRRICSCGPLVREGVVFLSYRRSRWNDFNFAGGAEQGAYGMTFTSEAHVRTDWAEIFDVIAVLPRSWWMSIQDLVILQKAHELSPNVRTASATQAIS